MRTVHFVEKQLFLHDWEYMADEKLEDYIGRVDRLLSTFSLWARCAARGALLLSLLLLRRAFKTARRDICLL
jgi:hypothetical protein